MQIRRARRELEAAAAAALAAPEVARTVDRALAGPLTEAILIGGEIQLRILSISRSTVKIGITAPREIPVKASDMEEVQKENWAAAQVSTDAAAAIARLLAALTSAALWKNIVIDGAFEVNGMIGWSDFLSPEEAETIRAYVAARARELQEVEARNAPPTPPEPASPDTTAL